MSDVSVVTDTHNSSDDIMIQTMTEDVDVPSEPTFATFTSGSQLDFRNTTLNVLYALAKEEFNTHETVRLTWYNLCLHSDVSQDLYNIHGYVLPGEMLCILGDNSSGSNELLQILGRKIQNIGQGANSHGYVSGEVLTNGIKLGTKAFDRQVSYVSKTEDHLAHLTLRETMLFAARIKSLKYETDEDIQQSVDRHIHWLGLDSCKNTLVGDATIKGISGGQKRRLSIGVETCTDYSCLLSNLPTNGLDAKTAYDIVKTCQTLCMAGKSMVMTLAQPSEALVQLFNNICMLTNGHQIFFGPVGSAREYFESIGFQYDEDKTLPQWLEELCSNPTNYYVGEERDVFSHLVNSFVHSPYYNMIATQIFRVCRDQHLEIAKERFLAAERSFSNQPDMDMDIKLYLQTGIINKVPERKGICNQIWLLFTRQILIQLRNKEVLLSRTYQSLVVAFFTGIVFNASHGPRAKISLVFFVVEFMALSSIPFIPQIYSWREVFYAQSSGAYFQKFAYFLSIILAELPFTLLESMMFCLPVYFLGNFTPDVFKFYCFYYMLTIVRFIGWTTCNILTFLCPTATISQEFATLLLPIWIMIGGFYIPFHEVEGIMQWACYTSFISYAFRFLCVNEYYYTPNHQSEQFKQMEIFFGKDWEVSVKDWHIFDASIIWLWVLVFSLFSYLAIFYINWRSRGKSRIRHYWDLLMAWYYNRVSKIRQTGQHLARPPPEPKKLGLEVQPKDAELSNIEGITLQWSNLSYFVGKKQNIQILKDIDGFVEPGMMIALMGPSGAGKTTLMNVLAGKTDGRVTGEILMNGTAFNSTSNRYIGYVEQFDSHLHVLTVKEAIRFSADLRLGPEYTSKQKDEMVENVMSQLGISNMADTTIGEGSHSISQEARKKVSIAVELVSKPGLLFLDEPTTGLDAYSALEVISAVKKMSKEGLAVICTIHQPSPEVFSLFDKVLLLKASPGEVIYFHDVQVLPEWFEDHGYGVMHEDDNPADFGIEAQSNKENPEEEWKNSEEYKDLNSKIKNGLKYQQLVEQSSPYASSFALEFYILFSRSWKMWTREKIEIATRFLQMILMGIVVGVLYFDLNPKKLSKDPEDINDLPSSNIGVIAFTFVVLEFATETAAQEIPHLTQERPMLYRELESKTYRVWVYYGARYLALCPILFAQSLIFFIFSYPISHYNIATPIDYFVFLIVLFVIFACATVVGQIHSICTPTEGVGNTLYTTFCTLSRACCGFIVLPKGMNLFSRICSCFNFMKYLFTISGHTTGPYGFTVYEIDNLEQAGDWYSWVMISILFFGFHLVGILTIIFVKWSHK